MIRYDLIPAKHMASVMQRYIEHGIRPGHFLTALLCNDFMEAATRADDTNGRLFYEWAVWLHNYAPPACYGSEARFRVWTAAAVKARAAEVRAAVKTRVNGP